MEYVFQTPMRLYFVMPFIRGGELYKHFLTSKRFPEEVVKFYAYQIALAIGHLHSKDIIHRDLKLENILVDEEGYLKIIDFGLAKILKEEETTDTFCGTPEYLAPEMVSQRGHDKNVDWWALGVLVYELLVGVSPFYNRNRNVMLSKIKASRVVFPDPKKFKISISEECKDFICKLLDKKPTRRLGHSNGIEDIIQHPWFAVVNKEEILNKEIIPPFRPDLNDELDTKYFNAQDHLEALTETMIPEPQQKEIQMKND